MIYLKTLSIADTSVRIDTSLVFTLLIEKSFPLCQECQFFLNDYQTILNRLIFEKGVAFKSSLIFHSAHVLVGLVSRYVFW